MVIRKVMALITASLILGYTAPLMALDVVETFTDYHCLEEYTLVDPDDARANIDYLCSQIGDDDMVRLEGGGMMFGQDYGCNIIDNGPGSLGGSLCVQLQVAVVEGDNNCQSGFRLVTPFAAESNNAYVCSYLDESRVYRLSNGGSISGNDCTVLDEDPAQLEESLCRKTLHQFSAGFETGDLSEWSTHTP